jgi:hypothetical protein
MEVAIAQLDPEQRTQLRAEVSHMQDIDCEHICGLLTSWETSDVIHYISEVFVSGNLQEYLSYVS